MENEQKEFIEELTDLMVSHKVTLRYNYTVDEICVYDATDNQEEDATLIVDCRQSKGFGRDGQKP